MPSKRQIGDLRYWTQILGPTTLQQLGVLKKKPSLQYTDPPIIMGGASRMGVSRISIFDRYLSNSSPFSASMIMGKRWKKSIYPNHKTVLNVLNNPHQSMLHHVTFFFLMQAWLSYDFVDDFLPGILSRWEPRPERDRSPKFPSSQCCPNPWQQLRWLRWDSPSIEKNTPVGEKCFGEKWVLVGLSPCPGCQFPPGLLDF